MQKHRWKIDEQNLLQVEATCKNLESKIEFYSCFQKHCRFDTSSGHRRVKGLLVRLWVGMHIGTVGSFLTRTKCGVWTAAEVIMEMVRFSLAIISNLIINYIQIKACIILI